jgi:hypothetical protein
VFTPMERSQATGSELESSPDFFQIYQLYRLGGQEIRAFKFQPRFLPLLLFFFLYFFYRLRNNCGRREPSYIFKSALPISLPPTPETHHLLLITRAHIRGVMNSFIRTSPYRIIWMNKKYFMRWAPRVLTLCIIHWTRYVRALTRII